MISAELAFQPSVFNGGEFPSCEFLKPGKVCEWIGDYTFDITFYDRNYGVVEKPSAAERYGAVVKIKAEDGFTYTRFRRGSYGNQLFFSEETFEKMIPQKLDRLLGSDTKVTWGIGLTWFRGNGLSDRTIGHGSVSSCTLRVDLENDLVITMTRATAGRNFKKYHPRFITAVTDGIQH